MGDPRGELILARRLRRFSVAFVAYDRDSLPIKVSLLSGYPLSVLIFVGIIKTSSATKAFDNLRLSDRLTFRKMFGNACVAFGQFLENLRNSSESREVKSLRKIVKNVVITMFVK